jgi:hypothetical protein
MEIGEIPIKSEKDNIFEKAAGEMIEKFSENGINYYVIGSFTRNIYIGH